MSDIYGRDLDDDEVESIKKIIEGECDRVERCCQQYDTAVIIMSRRKSSI